MKVLSETLDLISKKKKVRPCILREPKKKYFPNRSTYYVMGLKW